MFQRPALRFVSSAIPGLTSLAGTVRRLARRKNDATKVMFQKHLAYKAPLALAVGLLAYGSNLRKRIYVRPRLFLRPDMASEKIDHARECLSAAHRNDRR
jgi:hypothetical protein